MGFLSAFSLSLSPFSPFCQLMGIQMHILYEKVFNHYFFFLPGQVEKQESKVNIKSLNSNLHTYKAQYLDSSVGCFHFSLYREA